jgi:hypothetical protein
MIIEKDLIVLGANLLEHWAALCAPVTLDCGPGHGEPVRIVNLDIDLKEFATVG